MPLAPHSRTHPQLERAEGRAGQGWGPSPEFLNYNAAPPGGGEPRTSRPATPPPLPVAPAVRGPRQRKTKTWAEETAAGAPPENPGQKAWASHPRCLTAQGLASPSAVLPGPGSPGPVGVPMGSPSPNPCAVQLFFLRLPSGTPISHSSTHRRGRCDPSPDVVPGPAQPDPSSEPSPGGAGAPNAAGSRPGRRRLHSSGRSGDSAARAQLGAPSRAQGAGNWEPRGRAPRGRGLCCSTRTSHGPDQEEQFVASPDTALKRKGNRDRGLRVPCVEPWIRTEPGPQTRSQGKFRKDGLQGTYPYRIGEHKRGGGPSRGGARF